MTIAGRFVTSATVQEMTTQDKWIIITSLAEQEDVEVQLSCSHYHGNDQCRLDDEMVVDYT